MPVFEPGQIVTVFRSRLRDDHLDDYGREAERMAALAAGMPGLVEFKAFTADDGERVTIVTFADQASHDRWRDHAEHRAAQNRGRTDYYSEFSIQVCRTVRAGSFVHKERGAGG